jgi:hypothetical protein
MGIYRYIQYICLCSAFYQCSITISTDLAGIYVHVQVYIIQKNINTLYFFRYNMFLMLRKKLPILPIGSNLTLLLTRSRIEEKIGEQKIYFL